MYMYRGEMSYWCFNSDDYRMYVYMLVLFMFHWIDQGPHPHTHTHPTHTSGVGDVLCVATGQGQTCSREIIGVSLCNTAFNCAYQIHCLVRRSIMHVLYTCTLCNVVIVIPYSR